MGLGSLRNISFSGNLGGGEEGSNYMEVKNISANTQPYTLED